MLYGTCVQRAGKAADVIFVRVRTDDVVQRLHVLLLQIGNDEAGIGDVAAVDEHRFPAAANESGVRLADIDEMYFDRVVRLCGDRALRRSGGGAGLLTLPFGKKRVCGVQRGVDRTRVAAAEDERGGKQEGKKRNQTDFLPKMAALFHKNASGIEE